MGDRIYAKRTHSDHVQEADKTDSQRKSSPVGDPRRLPLWAHLAYANQIPPALRLWVPQLPSLESVKQKSGSPADDSVEERLEQASQVASPEKENATGLPAALKAGVENLSGMPMDDVSVHYNFSEPAKLQALAYTQGAQIHVGPGQERHLPHEAWHVVQQKQGRVKPTEQVNGIAINDSVSLEKEADSMGAKAFQAEYSTNRSLQSTSSLGRNVVQGTFIFSNAFHADIKSSDVQTHLENVNNAQFTILRNNHQIEVDFDIDDSNDVNPGDTTIEFNNGAVWQNIGFVQAGIQYPQVRVRINVRRWFVNRYDLGTVVSMFLHELGAHVLPFTNILNKMTMPSGIDDRDRSAIAETTGYQEHIEASVPGRPAFDNYRQLVHDAAGQFSTMGLPGDATSMLRAYLLDLSTFDTTGHRLRSPYNRVQDIVDYFSFLRARPGMDWMDTYNVPQNITNAMVWGHYISFYLSGLPAGVRMLWESYPRLRLLILVLLLYVIYTRTPRLGNK